MNWEEFQSQKKLYIKTWEELKAQTIGSLLKFLGKSKIVIVSGGRQAEFDADMIAVAQSCPDWFVLKGKTTQLLELAKEISELKTEYRSQAQFDRQRELRQKVSQFDPKSIFIIDDWWVEIRFPAIDMELIQQIKALPYCDKQKTMLSRASIAVVIKKWE